MVGAAPATTRESGIPSATAYRLLNLLVADGYLVRIADLSGFALRRRTRELAGAVPEPAAEFRPISAVVEELRARVRFGSSWPRTPTAGCGSSTATRTMS